jgi:hypothetical protein
MFEREGLTMLDDLALGLLSRTEGELFAAGLVVFATGFAAALIGRRGATRSMRRVPYFLWISVVTAFVSALPIVWVATLEAAKDGVLWILVVLFFGGIFGGGAATGTLAHARSVSAYGDGSNAWMGIVPIANLVLLLKPPENRFNRGYIRVLYDVLLVVFSAFILTIGSTIGKLPDKYLDDIVEAGGDDPGVQQFGIDFMLRTQGLEAVLGQMAAAVPGRRIDEATYLLRVESDGDKLRYVYELSTDIPEIPVSVRTALTEKNCASIALRPVIDAGATLEHVYQYPDGSIVGVVDVSQSVCRR